MSEMQTQIVMRFQVKPKEEHVAGKTVKEYTKEWFQKEPDVDDGDDFFFYDPDNNGNWTLNVIDGKVFLDYIYVNDRDAFDIDQDIRAEDMQMFALSFVDKFVKGNQNPPYVVDQKLKILYFYNGGTSGVAEIE